MLGKINLFHYEKANGQLCALTIEFTYMFALSPDIRFHAQYSDHSVMI